MRILFIGDIVGKIGRNTVAKVLPSLVKEKKIDFVIANGENSAHGSGMTDKTVEQLFVAGVDCITSGDHAYKRPTQAAIYKDQRVLAPANFSAEPLSCGFTILEDKKKNKVLVINLIGRVFMKLPHECPFKKIDEILANNFLHTQNLSAIIVDIHAEASSEKICLYRYLDGKVSALIGTHTHVQTADAQISPKNTAYITDAGMAGFADGSLGLKSEGLIKTFRTNIKHKHDIPETGKAIFNGVILDIDPKTRAARSIRPVIEHVDIN